MLGRGNDARGFCAPPHMFLDYKRLKRLEEKVDELERGAKRLALEWEDTYERIRAMLQRLGVRARDAEKAQAAADEARETLAPAPPTAGMSKRAAEAQARILARRQRPEPPTQ